VYIISNADTIFETTSVHYTAGNQVTSDQTALYHIASWALVLRALKRHDLTATRRLGSDYLYAFHKNNIKTRALRTTGSIITEVVVVMTMIIMMTIIIIILIIIITMRPNINNNSIFAKTNSFYMNVSS
jgi:hypothetical protein